MMFTGQVVQMKNMSKLYDKMVVVEGCRRDKLHCPLPCFSKAIPDRVWAQLI